MTILQEIIKVFRKENNAWLDYNEIYDLMDKSCFGPNKYGERGKRNIVYRLILGNDLFDVDENSRPKKFRLSSIAIEEKDIDEIENVISTGETKIFINNTVFEEIKFSYEKDYEREIVDNFKLIFGKDAVYYDIKKKVGDRICDGIVFNRKNKKVYIVEAELFTHGLWEHIVPQIIEFFNGMKEEKTKHRLKYDVDWKEQDKLAIIEAIDNQNYDIMVIIDKITFEIKSVQKSISELIKNFVKNKKVDILFKEFNVFINEEQNKIFRIN